MEIRITPRTKYVWDIVDALINMAGFPSEYAISLVEKIPDAPTIEAEPVRHGKWIDGRPYVNSRWRVCSECHKSAHHPSGGDNYCPNCGAKMDLEG